MRVKRALTALILLSFVVHVLLLLLLPGDGAWVEAIYARHVYPSIGPVAAWLPARLPFSVAIAGIIVLLIWSLGLLALNLKRWLLDGIGIQRALGRTLLAWAVVASLLFHGFYLCWGYNYLRPPFEQRFELAAVDTSDAARARTSRLMVERAIAAIVPVTEWDHAELDRLIDQAIARALHDLESRPAPVVSPLKGDLGTGYLALTGNGGFVSPLTLEAHVDFGLPPFALAFTAAHEKAHLAGFARERDANFVAWYALIHADDPRLQFAGHFGAARYFLNQATTDLMPPLMPYFTLLRDYSERSVSPAAREASRRVYGVYMRANRMTAGLADYNEVANLIHTWLLQADGAE